MDSTSLRNINSLFSISDAALQNILCNNMSNIFCILCSKYVKCVRFKDNDLQILTTCIDCEGIPEGNINETLQKLRNENKHAVAVFKVAKHVKNDSFVNLLYKHCTNMLQSDCSSADQKLACIKALKMISKHKATFFGGDSETWLSLAGHEDKIIRNALTEVVYFIVKNLLVGNHRKGQKY